ncbi:MAG: HAMP domain-containing sensor histidine kinase, partial [Planctomycetota bacterium]
ALVRGLRRFGDETAAAEAYRESAPAVPWDAAVEGTSGRLLALFSVAHVLDPESRKDEAHVLRDGIARGTIALPHPVDQARATRNGFVVELDPWWTALREAADDRCDDVGLDWGGVFGEEERANATIAALAPETNATSWTLRPLEGGPWIAARQSDDGMKLALHDGAQLAAAVAALAEDDALRASAFVQPSAGIVLSDAGRLEATDVALTVWHPDPERPVRAERRRVAWLRGGLLALALLVLVATALAARTIARARALDELRSTFVASVSHDLRTPLASIGLMAENLASGYARGNEDRYVEAIQRETRRLGRLVDDLLDFGRLERGLAPNVAREDVALDEWLGGLEARERARCVAAGYALSVERGPLPATARVDANALERAIANLVGNALQHSECDAIRLRIASEGDGLLAFEVEDAGRGLPRGVVHEHLFEPFRRDGNSAGTGLGLAIVRAIAEAHGGTATLGPGSRGTGVLARVTVRAAEEDAA